MRVLTSDSLSSTEMNAACKDSNFPSLGVSQSSSDESQQTTPRVANTGNALGPSETEKIETFRVTVLYLEGMTSPIIPPARISTWVGFRSSFPSESMSISSSNYSSHFLREGKLLAICSDQVKWTPNDESDGNISYSGIAFWDSVSKHGSTGPHLEVTIPTQTPPQSHDEFDIKLPDILEFHTCIVCETTGPPNSTETKSLVCRKNQSNASSEWNNEIEETHWYIDDEDSNPSTLSLEPQLQHGVAHLKVQLDSDDDDTFTSDKKIINLPIRMIKSRPTSQCNNAMHEHDVSISEHCASLTIQVEKVLKTKDSASKQRHYVKHDWNGGQKFAPPSINCTDESSKENVPRDTMIAKHFRFDTIKDIITTGWNSADVSKGDTEQIKVTIEDDQVPSHDESMSKIHEALESSFKSTNDSKKLAAALRESRGKEPKQLNDYLLNDCMNAADKNLLSGNEMQELQGTNSPKKSITTRLSQLFCADLSEVMLHCDEDHVGMYVDSLSLSSINT